MTVADLTRIADALRLLADVECARLGSDWDKVSFLLDPVDPIELYSLAAFVHVEIAFRNDVSRRPPRRLNRRSPW